MAILLPCLCILWNNSFCSGCSWGYFYTHLWTLCYRRVFFFFSKNKAPCVVVIQEQCNNKKTAWTPLSWGEKTSLNLFFLPSVCTWCDSLILKAILFWACGWAALQCLYSPSTVITHKWHDWRMLWGWGWWTEVRMSRCYSQMSLHGSPPLLSSWSI